MYVWAFEVNRVFWSIAVEKLIGTDVPTIRGSSEKTLEEQGSVGIQAHLDTFISTPLRRQAVRHHLPWFVW